MIYLMFSHSFMSNFLQPHGLLPARLLCPWNFSGKNNGVGFLFLLQGIFPTWESTLGLLHLLHWQTDSLPLSHLGSPSWYLHWWYIHWPTASWSLFVVSQMWFCPRCLNCKSRPSFSSGNTIVYFQGTTRIFWNWIKLKSANLTMPQLHIWTFSVITVNY